MVKVKVEKKMNLLELIDWAWKNGVKEKHFIAILTEVLCILTWYKQCL